MAEELKALLDRIQKEGVEKAEARSAEILKDAEAKAADLVRRRTGDRPRLEASGGVTLDDVRRVADTGVDMISVGALTHSAPALDLSMEFAGGG